MYWTDSSGGTQGGLRTEETNLQWWKTVEDSGAG